jgi:hypothetical protein
MSLEKRIVGQRVHDAWQAACGTTQCFYGCGLKDTRVAPTRPYSMGDIFGGGRYVEPGQGNAHFDALCERRVCRKAFSQLWQAHQHDREEMLLVVFQVEKRFELSQVLTCAELMGSIDQYD